MTDVITAGILEGVPNQPKTPLHCIRVSDDEWETWKKVAEAEGTTLADFIRTSVNNRVKRIARKRAGDSDV
ncbi:helix-turn-helix DNA binding protein [Gordonia phage Getalong]|uniref:Helix-turn-helix DNA binding protein n=1 Tax=Gordonia phage Getalong TaxID=2315531 RepID=A0A386KEB4_9CAUD|nr:Arc-like repressor [Gordonia phage Getalong]AYD83905.1 helix-turn-helix DNA binding protein [Gordonia phage Getalong]